ncbi:MAG TPA: Smr/MutS family protein [Steroidobacteraceae bacterium]|jgi:DNA-nicking Smr family endonuclease|nr:Smr/MutS family protein [Steroidobacteraceae bacterium]
MVKPRPRSPRQDSKPHERSAERGAAGRAATTRDAPDADAAGTLDDAAMFRAAVGEVRPVASTGASVASAPPTLQRRSAAAARGRTEPEEHLPLLPDTIAADQVVGGTDALSFRRPGVRDQEMRKLRRGLYAIEGDLDLHGLSQAAARDSLSEFLEYNRDAGHRCVRIVHGKGYRSGARGPILKIAVNAWLRRHPRVMAFTSARAIDGGTGAVYVLLRS